MAKRTEVVLVDDIDGSAADSTVAFSLDGVSYEIDLSAANAGVLRADFARWIDRARRTGGRRHVGRRPSGAEDVAAMRAWASANGMPINSRGRIPSKIREAYLAAQ
ncbi:MAG: Lsr2 family protein [Propionibacteriaceae bacterium]|jgi:hypothetical protein|nr:Lsr2 family protein [Propionibacteriaceae bacterium]